jgi:hypothetical protein
VRLFQADAVIAAVGGAQRVDGLEAPFVGRGRDLRLVKDMFHATQEEQRPRLVTVIGAAGIGKSRLGWEFEKYTDGLAGGVSWHRGRSLSYGEGVAFWAFAEMVRSRLDLTETDSGQVADTRIAEGLEHWVPDTEERAWIAPRLAVLLGRGEGGTFERTDLFAAWTVFLERVGEGDPVVLVFEDLHHADDGLLDLIDHLLDTARFPLFLLAITRPELLERRPGLAAGRRTTPLYLEPLPDLVMSELVEGLVHGLPDSARTALVERAEGVPLYAVETVRSLIDRDAVVPQEGRYVFVDHAGERVDLTKLAAPASLQTLIAARLDALSTAERRLVQDASVLGLSFSQTGLAAVTDPGLDPAPVLESLVRKEIFELQSDPRSPERGQYRFLQAIVRQTAYDTLSKRDRKARHLAVAAHFADEALDDVADMAAVIAQHYLDALAAGGSDDADRASLSLQATEMLVRAAARAEVLGSPAQALRHVEVALELSGEGPSRHSLLERAARNARMAGQASRALELAQAAKEGYTTAGRDLDAVRVLLIEADAMRELGRLQQAVDLLTPAWEALRDRPDAQPELLKLTSALCGNHVFLGNHDVSHRFGMQAMQLAEATGDPAEIANALYRVSLGLLYLGSPTASRALLMESIRSAREGNLTSTLALALNNLASMTYPWDLAAASGYAAEALTLHGQVGDRSRGVVAVINVCVTQWLSGGYDEVDRLASEWLPEEPAAIFSGLDLFRNLVRSERGEQLAEQIGYGDDLGDAYDRASVQAMQALRLAQQGSVTGAAVLADEAARDYVGVYGYEDDLVMFWSIAVDLALAAEDLPRVRDLRDLGDAAPTAARTPLLLAHLALYDGQIAAAEGRDPEASLRDALLRFTAYGAPFRLAQAQLALGTWLGKNGQPDEATGLFDAAERTFTALRATPRLAEVAQARNVVHA